MATLFDQATPNAESERAVFTKYVQEISEQQRNIIANRVIKIAAHQRKTYTYFFGSQALSCGGSLTLLWFFGPRNVFSNSSYIFRALGPAFGMGLTLYGILYQSRLVFMKFRVWAMVEDFEYELRRVKAHHVPEGATHLAWLEFVLEQVKADRTTQLDPAALRKEPKNIGSS